MIQLLYFLIFINSFTAQCSQGSSSEKKDLLLPSPLIIVSEDFSLQKSHDLTSESKNNENSGMLPNMEEKERSSRLSLSAVGTCLMIAQRRHSKWSSPNSCKRKSIKSNNDENDTQTSPAESNKGPTTLKKMFLDKPSSFHSTKTASSSGQTESFYSDTDDDGMDYQRECSLSLEKAQQELLASLRPQENKDVAKKREKLKESLDTFSFPKDEK